MRIVYLAVVLISLADCSPGRAGQTVGDASPSVGGQSFPAGSFGALCNGTSTHLVGTARAPNGSDPVAAAHVYIVANPQPIAPGVACDVCDHPIDTALAETTAAADGTFDLDIDNLPQGASLKLVVAKGRFRHVADLPIAACTAVQVPTAASTLPGKSSEGDLPRIAVATGNTDHLDVVLQALGVREFDCFTGTRPGTTATAGTPCAANSPDIATLLSDPKKLATYNMLFLSCAPGKYALLASPQTVIANLQAWVKSGGRLFATDESYNYVEQAFASSIDFYPGSATASAAQPIDQANVGVGAASKTGGATYMGTITDPALETWLQAVGAISPESNVISLTGFLNPWAAQKDLGKDARTEVTATAAYYTTTATAIGSPSTTATMPMTVEWDYQMCGRVLFSSYHTLPSTTQGQKLLPQEKILEYLMLDIGSCLSPIG